MNYEPIAMDSFRAQDPLMEYEWPPVMPSTGLTGVFAEFGNLSPTEQRFYLESLRADSDRHAHQQPRLTAHEVREVLWGAHTAVAAGTRLYDESLKYFKGNT